MEIKIIGFILGLILIVIIYNSFRKYKNYFHPLVIFPTLQFLATVPGLIFLKHESSVIFTFEGVLILFVNELIYVLSAVFCMSMLVKHNVKSSIYVRDIPLYRIIIFFLVGLYAKFIVFKKLGGLAFVIANAQLSYELQTHGFGIYITMYKFMLVAIIAMFDKFILHKKTSLLIILVGMVIIYMLSFLIYTSRTPAFIILLIIIFIVNFEWSRFKLKSLAKAKFIIPTLFIILASNYATSQRTSTGDLVDEESPLIDMVRNMSNDGRDMFVYEHFNYSNFWYGLGYLNIPLALNPLVEDKPSLDDGIYLVNYLRGFNVDINSNMSALPSQTGSVPFSTPAYMFANFGTIGVIFGGLIMGWIYMIFYNRMLSRTNAFSITTYFLIIYSFGLSTGRMIPTLISIIFIIVSEKILCYHRNYFIKTKTTL